MAFNFRANGRLRPPLRWLPFLDDIAVYTWPTLRFDLQAGVTVAVFAVPQVMAYAMLADVPPVYGLYTAIIMSVVAALWGSSPYLNSGPSNSAALLTAVALLPYTNHGSFIRIVFCFTLMVGVMRLAMGLLRFGNLVDFVPESAFLGFTVGAGLLIAFGQLHHLLGVSGSRAVFFPRRMADVLSHAGDLNPWTLAIGLGSFAVLMALDRCSRRIPVAIVVIGAGAVLARAVGDGAGIRLVREVASVPRGLPTFELPYFDLNVIRGLLPAALAVAVIGLVEAVSIGQSLALKRHQSLNFDQEFIGQGLSHVVGAFFQGIPGSGSFGRSLLIEQSGGQTRMANVCFGTVMALLLLSFPSLLERIPICSLSGLLLFVGYKLVDHKRIRGVFATSRTDSAVLVITFLTTVFVRIEYGIFSGILLSALIHLNRTRELHMAELIPRPGHGFIERPYDGRTAHPAGAVVAVGLSGDLFYGVSLALRHRLVEIAVEQRPRCLILRARRAYSIDYSCWSTLFRFAEQFAREGGTLYLCGIRHDVLELIEKAGLQDVIQESHVYPASAALFRGFEECVHDVLAGLPAEAPLSDAWREYRRRAFCDDPHAAVFRGGAGI